MNHIVRSHNQLGDDEYEQQFRDCTFKPRLFSHEAHLRLAWIHIRKYGLEQAEINLCEDIIRFANHVGFATKFNRTITIASAKILHHFMSISDADSFDHLIEEFPDLLQDFKKVLAQHYSFDIIKNEEARTKYLAPDLLAF